jgi:hypothetical protein
MTTTYTSYHTYETVTIKGGRVIESTCEWFPVGTKLTGKQLLAGGAWKKEKKVAPVYVNGLKNGLRYYT